MRVLAGDLMPRHVGHTIRIAETVEGRLDRIGRPVFGMVPVTVDGARYTLWPDALVEVTFDPGVLDVPGLVAANAEYTFHLLAGALARSPKAAGA